jgi:hypothetical protein
VLRKTFVGGLGASGNKVYTTRASPMLPGQVEMMIVIDGCVIPRAKNTSTCTCSAETAPHRAAPKAKGLSHYSSINVID